MKIWLDRLKMLITWLDDKNREGWYCKCLSIFLIEYHI